MVLGGETEAERSRRVHDVIRGCIQRRVVGETLPDEEVASDHPDLMPELGQELQALALIQQAEERASDTANRATGISADVTLPANSFPGYEIIGEIHRGGQGVVYEALQKSTQRKVAIKAMKEGPFGCPGDKTRFEREVQILGQLKHPHIVTIHDSGSVAGGLYFVMDYIAGNPLDEFMARKERTIPETLDLFACVCDAVNAAHLRGIIHRDLKPSNIRVDTEAEPHILDFGLAKVTTGEDERGGMTMTGQFVGSVPWASPEQAEGIPQKIDMRTDVYSLGMILYHMLTGRFPYEVTGSIRDVIDNILKAEPIRPSTIHKRIDDEVETIVLKCLSKEAERRYQTAGELVRDIRHYLAGEPIDAKRDSVGYVLAKHFRKHKLPVLTAIAFVLVITVGLFASLAFWHQAVRERDAAEVARSEAERQAKIAQAVNSFLNDDLLAAANPLRSPNHEITVREVLDAAVEKIESRFEGEPLVEAGIRLTLGNTYRGIGEYELAEEHLSRALDVRRLELGEEHPAALWAMEKLAELHEDQGRYTEAEELYTAALEGHRRVLGEDDWRTLQSLRGLAVLHREQGRYDEAERLCVRSLELRQHIYGEAHPRTATAMLDLATLYVGMGRYDEAEPLYLETLDIWRGDHDAAARSAKAGLAQLYRDRGRYEEAERLLLEVVEAEERALGNEHHVTLVSMGILAELYRVQGRYDEAEPLFVRLVDSKRRVLRNEHRSTLTSMNNLALVYRNQERYLEAEPLFTETLETSRRVLGLEHPLTLACMTNYAILCRQLERYDNAEALYLEALEVKRRVLGDEHPHTLACMASLGALYRYMARYDEAEPLLVRAAEMYRRTLGENHPHTFVPLYNLAFVKQEQERYEEAERLYREVLEGRRRILGPSHRNTLQAQYHLALTLVAREEFERAEPLLRECLEVQHTSTPNDDPPRVANTESLLGGCLARQGRYDEAEALLLQSYPRLMTPGEEPNERIRAACQRIIDLYDAWGKPDQAAEWRAKLPRLPEVSKPPGT